MSSSFLTTPANEERFRVADSPFRINRNTFRIPTGTWGLSRPNNDSGAEEVGVYMWEL
jgi:hypothetical protein